MLKQCIRIHPSMGARDRGYLYTAPHRTDQGKLLIFMEPRLPYLLNGVITFPQERLLGAQTGWGQRRKSGKPSRGGEVEQVRGS